MTAPLPWMDPPAPDSRMALEHRVPKIKGKDEAHGNRKKIKFILGGGVRPRRCLWGGTPHTNGQRLNRT